MAFKCRTAVAWQKHVRSCWFSHIESRSSVRHFYLKRVVNKEDLFGNKDCKRQAKGENSSR